MFTSYEKVGKFNRVGNVLFLKLVARTWVLLCYSLHPFVVNIA